MDPILDPQNRRLVLHPIRHDDMWQLFKKAQHSFWTTEEIDFAADKKHYDCLGPDAQHFVKHIVAFFAASDAIVNMNVEKTLSQIAPLEAQYFLAFQASMENTHSETYSVMLQTIIPDGPERMHMIDAVNTVPAIKLKADWAYSWLETDDFAERIVAFACVEGIMFSGSFAAVFWLRKQGIMPGFGFANQLISRDEGLHTEFAALIYSKLQRKPSTERIHKIIKSAVDVECAFIAESLPVALLGMNNASMCQYIEFVADFLCPMLGVTKIYNTPNPYEWMDLISLEGKSNFFEGRVAEYAKAEHESIADAFNDKDDDW